MSRRVRDLLLGVALAARDAGGRRVAGGGEHAATWGTASSRR